MKNKTCFSYVSRVKFNFVSYENYVSPYRSFQFDSEGEQLILKGSHIAHHILEVQALILPPKRIVQSEFIPKIKNRFQNPSCCLLSPLDVLQTSQELVIAVGQNLMSTKHVWMTALVSGFFFWGPAFRGAESHLTCVCCSRGGLISYIPPSEEPVRIQMRPLSTVAVRAASLATRFLFAVAGFLFSIFSILDFMCSNRQRTSGLFQSMSIISGSPTNTGKTDPVIFMCCNFSKSY